MSNKRCYLTRNQLLKLQDLRGVTINATIGKNGKYRVRVAPNEFSAISEEVTETLGGEMLGVLESSVDKSLVTDMGDYFEIMISNGDIKTITKEKVLEIYEVYTSKNTTIDKACILLGITRTDFLIVKRAFNLTKSSYKYPDFCFSEGDYDRDTMVSYENQSRKIDFIQNVAKKKKLDQERRLKRYDTIGYWFDKAIDELKDLSRVPSEGFKIEKQNHSDDFKHILVIADTHLGIKSNNPFNKYNIDIARDRFKQIAQWVTDNKNNIKGKIHIVDLGDAISGYIHGSLREQNEIPVTTQLRYYMENLEDLLMHVAKYAPVTYRICCGNHARMYENKQDDINEANLETLIPLYLQARLSNSPRIKIFDQDNRMSVGAHEIKMFDYWIGAEHGNRVKFSDASGQWNSLYKKFFREVLIGHYHHRKSYVDNGTLVESFPSICGTDEFASNIKKNSSPEATFLTYNKTGRISEEYIYLK